MKATLDVVKDHAGQVLAGLLDSSVVPVMVLSPDHRVVSTSPAMIRLLESGSEPIDHEVGEMLDEESRNNLARLQPGTSDRFTMRFRSSRRAQVELTCDGTRFADGSCLLIGATPIRSNLRAMEEMSTISNQLANLSRELSRKNRELEDAAARIRQLTGIIPICMYCHEIRTDEGFWVQLERFVMENSAAEFSHGICDKCAAEHHPEMRMKSTGGGSSDGT